jgi:GNAT superfamily N-acetyltransferase
MATETTDTTETHLAGGRPTGPSTSEITTGGGVKLRLRPIDVARDADRLVEIANKNAPERVRSADDWRYYDAQWDSTKFERYRFAAELDTGPQRGLLVASGGVSHMPWQFHPRKYGINVQVDPDYQRRGIGGALFDLLIDELRARDALLCRAGTRESRPHVIEFLTHRGFVEIQRYWESRLHVPSFDFAPFAGAEERTAREGITITTLAEERRRDPSEALLRRLYEVETEMLMDVPLPEPFTPTSFDDFLRLGVNSPNILPEAWFLAKDGDQYVGESALWRQRAEPDVLGQGFTGVRREYRGKGVAMALKLQTVKYAKEHGIREIRTGNNTRNRPMLRINEAMGFVKQPVEIEYEKKLAER